MGHKKVLCVLIETEQVIGQIEKCSTLGESWIKPVKDLCTVFYFATFYKFEITPK